ncbi:unnamed protein product [Rotaria socialis]|uniref:Reverse transcriptase domain-containing protein n=1 Tax=Rotaria socialis TaxID=392032 RepID=A0A820U5B9_9BILA|nr:unnamed protein product [Rotaria socialis]CAF4481286.1 unnamed protein product [Rotaria socialis]
MSHYICNQCDGSSGDEKNYNGELINEKMNSRMNQNNIPNNDTNNDLKQNESSTKHKKPFKRQLTSSSYIGDNYPNDEDNDYFITVGKNSKRKQRTKDGNNEFDNNDENTLIIDHVNSSTTAPNVNTGRTFLNSKSKIKSNVNKNEISYARQMNHAQKENIQNDKNIHDNYNMSDNNKGNNEMMTESLRIELNKKSNTNENNKLNENNNSSIQISQHALHYAVENHLSPIRLECMPKINENNQGKEVIKALFSYMEKTFRQKNKNYQHPLGFDYWYINKSGDLICYTKHTELFVYLCEPQNYPTELENILITPTRPKHLPPQHSIVLKTVPNYITKEEIEMETKKSFKSIFSLEEMKGSFTDKSRHIRLELTSIDEYNTLLNNKGITINGHIINAFEFLSPPQILICSKCNDPGHIKRNCNFPYEACRRCGQDRTIGEHKECIISCHRCEQNHLATDYKCPFIIEYRRSLVYKLKQQPNLLPSNMQMFIPIECREKGIKNNMILKNPSNEANNSTLQSNSTRFNLFSHAWPTLNKTTNNNNIIPYLNDQNIWKELELKQDEINKKNDEINRKLQFMQTKYDDYMSKMGSIILIMSQQVKIQNDNIERCYTTMNEFLPILSSNLEAFQCIITKPGMLNPQDNKNSLETQNILKHISQSLVFIKDRSDFLTSNQKILRSLVEQQNALMAQIAGNFNGSLKEKNTLSEIINEWNSRTSISQLCEQWKKTPPKSLKQNLLLLLYNVESLNTHVADVDILLSSYNPHICILTGVGAGIKKNFTFPNYHVIAQTGTNSFGGVIILHHQNIKCKITDKEPNFILIEILLSKESIYIGGIYVPPKSLPPFRLLSKHLNKTCYIFGDINAKHTEWQCKRNNQSGIHLQNWLDETGNELIIPHKPTSKRSDSIIDFGITNNAAGWTSEVLNEGTSDHYPILFQSSISIDEKLFFRITNWKLFTFFLSAIYEYWLSIVYNIDEQTFFNLFSAFLASLWDRCSTFEHSANYRPPWPPHLVMMAKSVNRARRKYRRNRSMSNLQYFLSMKDIFLSERNLILQTKTEMKLSWISKGQNIWKFAKPSFHAVAPPFLGISKDSRKITNTQEIADTIANFFEKHFQEPAYDIDNPIHQEAIDSFKQIEYTPRVPLEQISIKEVVDEWMRFKGKKSTDSAGTSAFMLKQLPQEYMALITILFNKCAQKGNFFEASKHAKVICLSKDGLYPAENKLRPISLLPNIGKWYERIIHNRIIKWCEQQNIYVDEQSGFTSNRRLQTRITSLVEDIRLTIAACNRPALAIFIDFLSAFDRMWYPGLINSLTKLEMPLPLIKWISSWLINRSFSVHHGNANSRNINMYVGAPQGSVLAATLFRLHIHFLPSTLKQFTTHLFADDLALVFIGSLEKKFSQNIIDLEIKAKEAMMILEKFADNLILPVNVDKTKSLLIHNIVSPTKPNIEYKNQTIKHVSEFKYLGITITCKLGWGKHITKNP